ncbi:MAG: sigma 54-interacting transcriptional regulator [Deltaproteobacteria bacterium]|nr:sigma 54-interacting transcriptional regulator [Deltaproteobacteria bacterium]
MIQNVANFPEDPILLEQILNSLPVAFLLMDDYGRVLAANNHLAALLDMSAQEMVGLNISEFWPKTAGSLVEIANSDRQAIGMPLEEMNGCFLQATPISGPKTGLAISVFDRRLWQPFLESAPSIDPLTPYYKKIFESSADGISICDKDGRLIMVNAASAANVGLTPAQLVGRHVDFLVKERLQDSFVGMEVLETKKPVTKLVRHFKTGKYMLLTGKPILGANGAVHFVVINERDLTGIIKLQNRFDQQSEILARYKDEVTAVQLAELANANIVSSSSSMKLVLDTALKLARYAVKEILLTGESGTGKGLIAKFIHSNAANRNEPFIHINCAAIPETLLEAELFGYEKGLFTGGSPQGRAGLFEAAGQGAVFLDEIGEMPLSIQAKLLTFLDNHEFRRVGGSKLISSPCTIIAATNKDLVDLVDQKLFRQDLYFRLCVFCLQIPPLRSRTEDVLELASRELHRLNHLYGQTKALDPLAIEVLQSYDFPGNVRELLNCIHQSVLLSPSPQIGPFLKSFLDARWKTKPATQPRVAAATPSSSVADRVASDKPLLNEGLVDKEKAMLMEALTLCSNTREMAKFLGISQASISRKLKKHNLVAPGKRELSHNFSHDSKLHQKETPSSSNHNFPIV